MTCVVVNGVVAGSLAYRIGVWPTAHDPVLPDQKPPLDQIPDELTGTNQLAARCPQVAARPVERVQRVEAAGNKEALRRALAKVPEVTIWVGATVAGQPGAA